MFRRTTSLAALLLAFSAACAAHKPNQAKVASNTAPAKMKGIPKVICHNEMDTGSHVMEQVCVDSDVTEADVSSATQDAMSEMQRHSAQQAVKGN